MIQKQRTSISFESSSFSFFIKKKLKWITHFRRAPPGRLGSSFMRLPAMSLLCKDLRAASAALTS